MIDRDRALIERATLTDKRQALTYEEAEKRALRAIHDADGRGMVGRGRNHLHQRVARAILSAARDEGRAEGLGGWELHPAADWRHDDGNVLWWAFPISEPPYVGTPLDEGWPGYHTHWQRYPLPAPPASQTQEG